MNIINEIKNEFKHVYKVIKQKNYDLSLYDGIRLQSQKLMSIAGNPQDVLILLDIIEGVILKGYDLNEIKDAFIFIFNLHPLKVKKILKGVKDEYN